jgi:hypothetical protein
VQALPSPRKNHFASNHFATKERKERKENSFTTKGGRARRKNQCRLVPISGLKNSHQEAQEAQKKIIPLFSATFCEFCGCFLFSGTAQVQKPAHSAGSTFTKKNHFALNHFAKKIRVDSRP